MSTLRKNTRLPTATLWNARTLAIYTGNAHGNSKIYYSGKNDEHSQS